MPTRRKFDTSLWVHTILAFLGLFSAFVAHSQPQLGTRERRVVVLDKDFGPLREVVYSDANKKVVLSQASEDIAQITVYVPQAQGLQTPQTFMMNEQGVQFLKRLLPLPATRALGVVPDSDLTKIGLTNSPRTLTLAADDRRVVFYVGGQSFGSGDTYIMNEDHEVFLIRQSLLADVLRGGNAFEDRELVGLMRRDIDEVTLSAHAKERHVVQYDGDKEGKAYFANAGLPQKKLDAMTRFLDRVMRLRVVQLADIKLVGAPAVVLHTKARNGITSRTSIFLRQGTDDSIIAVSPRFSAPAVLQKLAADAVLEDLDMALADQGLP